jgi:hypothetical protein
MGVQFFDDPKVQFALILLLLAVLAAILLYLVARLCRRAFRGISSDQLGAGTVLTLISLAVSVSIFPDVAEVTLAILIAAFRALFLDFPNDLLDGLRNLESACHNSEGNSCSMAALDSAANSLSGFRADLGNAISGRPDFLIRAAYFFAFWAGLTVVLRGFVQQNGTNRAPWRRVGDWVSALAPVTRQNICVIGVMLFAAYLSIVSIAVVPILEEEVRSETADATKLRQQLETVLIKDEISPALVYQPNEAGDPFMEIRVLIGQGPKKAVEPPPPSAIPPLPVSALPPPPPLPPSLLPANGGPDPKAVTAQIVSDYEGQYKNLSDSYASLVSAYKSKQAEQLGAAVRTFEISNDGRKGVRERNDHFLAVDAWFRNWLTDANRQISRCATAVRHATEELKRVAGSLKTMSSGPDAFYGIVPPNFDPTGDCTSAETYFAPIPGRDRLGSHLGFFAFAGAWILQTESMPLALIVGMVGFGLLGALSSAFIRVGIKREAGKPLVEDMAGVIILGSSAALVIFLATFGGLAMFSATAVDPNPYVVLFTCFVAAVFSEDAWRWAHGKFISTIGEDDEDQAEEVKRKAEEAKKQAAEEAAKKEGDAPAGDASPIDPKDKGS